MLPPPSLPPSLPPPSLPPPPLSPPEDSPAWHQPVGIGIVLLGCLFNAASLMIMKYSADTEKRKTVFFPPRRPWLYLGIALLLISAAGLAPAALALLPLAMVAPFGGVTIVFSALLAATGVCKVREPLSRAQIVFILAITAGVTLVSFFGPKEEKVITTEILEEHFKQTAFLAFAITAWVFLVVFCTTQHLPFAAQERCRLSAALKRCRLSTKTIAVGDGFAAALFGAFSQTFLKMVAEVAEVTISQDGEKAGEAWTSWIPYISILGLVVCAPMQLILLNLTLRAMPVQYAVPLYQSLLMIATMTTSGLFFKEFSDEAWACKQDTCGLYPSLFGAGVLIALVGLIGLSRRADGKGAELADLPHPGAEAVAVAADEISEAFGVEEVSTPPGGGEREISEPPPYGARRVGESTEQLVDDDQDADARV
ncbi:hypothetical protein EMIHUDRAFT_442083 [Emiliania huxleyi CCMP1516]|uniref:Magnesium transporter n=2 Tax=Emiliania huxleyi TaxID=2903 RepID=A0A0D3JIM4_EMIH1|nr:hypothetical protein EMIHUDRAFT_444136 [Emiliania huxleyi CCMP1516]XP_005784185.1 hypothetical protein EMIHUDRAFT_442083 [Emiliania huxleyi CCMP1516]EOD23359.1 hypothetical protein EMIHUDRAFT_444136 [Emiliania huxleyi CCMP1516]EOD31756.1 hypothetical protein EMIHUDRAFT_442083 [Emiliania huxleyi CCMP1516]|eukprot:XP_005775788.1 hypothetical protein EMIHUDRAFT_444136 [Emiliania huxleyi CCMP1516]